MLLYIVAVLKSIWSAIIHITMILIALFFGPKNYQKVVMIYSLGIITGKYKSESAKDLIKKSDYYLQNPEQFFLKYLY